MISGKILAVDDERATRMAICEALRQQGHEVAPAASGSEAIAALSVSHYDVVILDLQMPQKGGMAVLEVSDELAPDTAFIILTAHASADTAITALRSGVFDYLIKPTALKVILETVEKAILRQRQQRRQNQAIQMLEQALEGLRPSAVLTTDNAPSSFSFPSRPASPLITAGEVVIDTQQQTAAYHNKLLKLTPVEYKLLCQFVQQPNAIVSYASLAQASHEMDLDETEARMLLRTHLFRLSRKLGGKEESPLQNIHSRGYILYTEKDVDL